MSSLPACAAPARAAAASSSRRSASGSSATGAARAGSCVDSVTPPLLAAAGAAASTGFAFLDVASLAADLARPPKGHHEDDLAEGEEPAAGSFPAAEVPGAGSAGTAAPGSATPASVATILAALPSVWAARNRFTTLGAGEQEGTTGVTAGMETHGMGALRRRRPESLQGCACRDHHQTQ